MPIETPLDWLQYRASVEELEREYDYEGIVF
jgi:hypothetical protein